MTVSDFENKVWDVDGIKIVVRAPRNADIGDYTYHVNALDENKTISQFKQLRIDPALKATKFEYELLDGELKAIYGGRKLSGVRNSYA